ncbi:hypothetical protein RLL38_00165 [Streptococcus pneumoniae]|nr:hypothetical protein [Streptococcus pneumoniae]
MDEAGEILLILFKNQSANYVNFTLPTKLQPVAGFLVCTLIFIEYKSKKALNQGSIIFVVGKSTIDIMEPILL